MDQQSITVFRSRLRDDVPGRRYGSLAGELEAKAAAMPGFVEFKEFVAADGERLALVTFASDEAEARGATIPTTGRPSRKGVTRSTPSTTSPSAQCSAVSSGRGDVTVPTTSPAWARSAMVATSNRLAVEAALWALGEGGSAVDAAVAADAVLGVVQPHSSGIGGDAFALVAEPGGAVVGFNGSGRAPATLTHERCLAPDAWFERSPLTVTVPGVVDAWEQLVARYGRLDLEHHAASGGRARRTRLPHREHRRDGVVERVRAPASRARAARATGTGAAHHERRTRRVAARHRPRRTRRGT